LCPGTPVRRCWRNLGWNHSEFEQSGHPDNFFELGGGIRPQHQIVAKANKSGLQLPPQTAFARRQLQVAVMAGTIRTIQSRTRAGDWNAASNPIQQWFFEQNHPDPPLEPKYFLEMRMYATPSC